MIHQHPRAVRREIPAVEMVVDERFLCGPNRERGRRGPKTVEMTASVKLVVDDVADTRVGYPVNAYGIDCVID